jgi:hypothetical protein
LSLWLLVYITCNTNGETETGLFWWANIIVLVIISVDNVW